MSLCAKGHRSTPCASMFHCVPPCANGKTSAGEGEIYFAILYHCLSSSFLLQESVECPEIWNEIGSINQQKIKTIVGTEISDNDSKLFKQLQNLELKSRIEDAEARQILKWWCIEVSKFIQDYLNVQNKCQVPQPAQ